MKLKYLSILLSGLVILPVGAFASADDPYTAYNNDGGYYDPNAFSLSDTFENNSLEVLDFSCSENDLCLLSIQDNNGFNCDIMSMGDSITYNNCDSPTLSSDGSNMLYFSMGGEGYAGFNYINLRLVDGSSSGAGGGDTPVDPENPEIPLDVVGSFKSTLEGLVSDLVVGLKEYLPSFILIGISILVLFVFFGYMKHVGVEVFYIHKNSNKSLGRFQNEDVNAMYKDRKTDFVKNHDLNNAVSKKYYNADDRQEIFEEDYFNNHDKYMYDELVYKGDHFFRSNIETGEEEELFTDGKWYKTGGNFKKGIVGRRFNVD